MYDQTMKIPLKSTVLAIAIFGFMLIATPLLAQDNTEPTVPIELPHIELPPQLDRVLRDYERAWRASDAVALASLFAEDGFILQDNQPPVRGRLAIQAVYENQGGGPLQLRALAYATGETVGYIIGTYGYGDTYSDTGKFTLTLRRTPGEPWLIFSDMDNPSPSLSN